MTRGAWRATVHGVAKSQIQLSSQVCGSHCVEFYYNIYFKPRMSRHKRKTVVMKLILLYFSRYCAIRLTAFPIIFVFAFCVLLV